MSGLEIDRDLDQKSKPSFSFGKINKKIILFSVVIFLLIVVGGVVLTNLDLDQDGTFYIDYSDQQQETTTFFPDANVDQNKPDKNIPSQDDYISQLPDETTFCGLARTTANLSSGVYALPTDSSAPNSNISNNDHHAKYFLIYNDGVFVEAWENYDKPTEKQVVEVLKSKGVENIITRRDFASGLNVEAKNNGINCYYAAWPRISMETLISNDPFIREN